MKFQTEHHDDAAAAVFNYNSAFSGMIFWINDFYRDDGTSCILECEMFSIKATVLFRK
jgi:hypothetical protein